MRKALGLGMAVLALTACGSGTSQEADLRKACEVIANDPEGKEAIADMKANTDSFCDCFNTNTLAMSDEDQIKVRAALAYIAEQSEETGQEVEDIALAIVRQGMLSPDDEAIQNVLDGVPLVGRMIDDIEEDFEDGSCQREA
ncbi:MAG: hypothetical protein AAGH90_03110 [Pseudomonadota bacterium]